MSLLTDFDVLSVRLREALKDARKTNAPDGFSAVELQTNDLRKIAEELRSLKQDRTERKGYANKLYWLVTVWLSFILMLILAQAIGKVPFTGYHFSVSDGVLITLISTTTANVAAFFLVVIRYLFRSK